MLKAFEKLKPYYVYRFVERNTCVCKYHIKMVELQKGFNNMSHGSKRVHGTNCNCNYDVVVILPITQVSPKLVA
jgi:hypothetical protein